jgi:hypothetical protein
MAHRYRKEEDLGVRNIEGIGGQDKFKKVEEQDLVDLA